MVGDDYMTKQLSYTGGHICRPNGVGDYEMVCPQAGVLPGFVSFMMRDALKGKCPGCGEDVRIEQSGD